ncbi:hypothetical protein AGMMS49965_19890 [Bacteroidia bacterium]|nr:hypothetical protein AGMMS49965_19890 [Bacteroidia bacterium]
METKDLIRLVLKNWGYFALSFFVCGLVGVLYYVYATPVFDVRATVSLRHNESLLGGSGLSAIGGGAASSSMLSLLGVNTSSENIEDESIKMASEGFLKNVVKELKLHTTYKQLGWFGWKTDLYDYSPIVLDVDENLPDTLSLRLDFKLRLSHDKQTIILTQKKKTLGTFEVASFPATIQTVYGTFTLSPSNYFNPDKLPMTLAISVENSDVAAQVYQKRVEVDFKKKTSDFLVLEMHSESPSFAKKILNAVIDNYNQEWDADKVLFADKTNTFIDQRLAVVSKQLAVADSEIQQFKTKNDLTDIRADVEYYFTVSGEMQAGLIEAKTQLEMANFLFNFVKDPANKYALIPFNMNATEKSIAEIIAEYNATVMRRNDLYNSNIQNGLTHGLEEQVEAQRKNMLQSISNMKDGLDIAFSNLRKKEVELNTKIGKIPGIEENYIHLKREQEVQQTIYLSLLEMREKMGVQSVTLFPKLKVIDAPYTKIKWISPSRKKLAILVLFFGLGFPIAGLYIQQLRRKEGGWM